MYYFIMLEGQIKQLEAGNKKEKKERKKTADTGALKIKLLLIVSLLISVFMFQKFILKNNGQSDVLSSETNNKVKDEKGSVESLKTIIADDVGKQVNELKDNVLGTATSFVEKKVDETKDKITDTVFEGTAKSISEQVDKLPKEQQEELKKYICK